MSDEPANGVNLPGRIMTANPELYEECKLSIGTIVPFACEQYGNAPPEKIQFVLMFPEKCLLQLFFPDNVLEQENSVEVTAKNTETGGETDWTVYFISMAFSDESVDPFIQEINAQDNFDRLAEELGAVPTIPGSYS